MTAIKHSTHSLIRKWKPGDYLIYLYQLWFLCTGLLKPPHTHAESYFPLSFPLPVRYYTGMLYCGHRKPEHFYWACLAMLCGFYDQGSLFRYHKFNQSLIYVLLLMPFLSGFAFLPNDYTWVLLEGWFLFHCRKNSKMRQGGQESKARIYLRDIILLKREQTV